MLACEACESTDAKIWVDGFEHHYQLDRSENVWPYRLMECCHCGLGFIDPMPDWKLLQTFYPADYVMYRLNVHLFQERMSLKYKLARLRYADYLSEPEQTSQWTFIKRMIAMTIEWISGRTLSYSLGIPLQFSIEAYLFEMGYGTGYWLYNMARLGYKNLYGYDISVNPVNTKNLQAQGIHLSSGRFLDNQYPEATFDCIRLEHVFEHVLEPLATLKKCWTMLKPGGMLVMTLPCKTSWTKKLFGQYSADLDPPVHLYHHTSESLRHLLERSNFRCLNIKVYSAISVLAKTVQTVLARHASVKMPKALFHPLSPFYALLGNMTNKGELITVVAQRGHE